MPNFRVGSTGCNSNMAGGRKLMTETAKAGIQEEEI